MTAVQGRQRLEGAAKVTGAAKYAADTYPSGALHAVLVCSPVAAGTVRAIDVAGAAAVPGVVRVLTHVDMPKIVDFAPPVAITHFPMQTVEIQWEGQPIAMVLAETLEAAEEAAPLVRARITTATPAIPGTGRIEKPRPPQLFPVDQNKGDVTRGMREAAATVRQSYFQPTRNHNPMETSACVAQWNGDQLTIWDSSQHNQNPVMGLAAAFGISRGQVRVISPHTGGGFGSKGSVWPHEMLSAQAAKLTGRPVRLHVTRAQMYSMTGHQPECRQTMSLGAGRDGKLTAIRHEAVNTTSIADLHFEAPGTASATYYACPNIRIEQTVEHVNMVRSCPMRSPIEGPGSWALESAMDELARELEIDPLDLRLLNFADKEPMEGKPWSSNKLLEAWEEASKVYGWRERHQRPRQDGVWTIGHGMSLAGTFVARFPSEARVRIRDDGRAIVEGSSNDIGTGTQTALQIIAAEVLGISPDQVEVRWGDTRYPPAGPVYGSSQTMGMGTAVGNAARDARRKLAAFGALEEGPLDLAAVMRRANVSEVTGKGAYANPGRAPVTMNGAGTDHAMGTWGANFIEVAVDRDLGLIRLRRFVGRYSAGRIVNPLAARSQMIGGVIWDWGKATMEASILEPRYARFLAKNLSNVALPVNADIPADAIDVDFIDEHDPHASAFGGRGIGELASTGVAAAVANAVYDAVGVRVREVPILPHHLLDASAAQEMRS
jgi:xanthine dehydrogenase YagR molybdenum-binding subunit